MVKEQQAREAAEKEKAAAAEKEKALKAEREKSAGAKRDASAILASAAKRTKIDAGKKPVAATKIGAAAVARPTTTTTIVRPASSVSKSSGLSFGGINIRGAGFQPERPAGLVKAAAKAKAPSPPPAPMLFKKKPSKRAAKGVTWPDSHDSLEMAKFFYKADPPVACNPDPEVVERLYDLGAEKQAPEKPETREEPESEEEADDEDNEGDEAAVAKARERQERELAAEARAAQLTRQRRLNEMRAKIKWRKPRRVPYAEDVEIAKGEESVEAARLRDLAKRTREVTFKSLDAVPDSPAEAPRADAGAAAASANTLEIPLLTKTTPEQQRQQEQQQRILQQQQEQQQQMRLQQQQRQMMHPHMRMPPGPPPPGQPRPGAPPNGMDPAALQALLSSVQSNPALMANLGAAKANGVPHMSKVCAFYNTPQGCHRGDKCKFKHVRDAPAGPDAFPFIKRQN